MVTFRLNKKWSERESEAQQGARIVRHHTARGPLYESQEAYLARTPNKKEGVGRIVTVKNTPEFHPDKPSPENKGRIFSVFGRILSVFGRIFSVFGKTLSLLSVLYVFVFSVLYV